MDTNSDLTEIRQHSGADFEESANDSSTRALSSRKGWSICWPTLMRRMWDYNHNTRFLNVDIWLDASSTASDNIRFEYCLGSHGRLQCIRSIQVRGGVPRIDSPFFYGSGESLCVERTHPAYKIFEPLLTGPSSKKDSLLKAPEIAEEGKHASSPLWTHPAAVARFQKNSPRTSLEWYTANIRKDQLTMQCTPFDLKTAQDQWVLFVKLAAALVRVVKCHRENLETEILFDTRSADVIDVHTRKAQIACFDLRGKGEPDQTKNAKSVR